MDEKVEESNQYESFLDSRLLEQCRLTILMLFLLLQIQLLSHRVLRVQRSQEVEPRPIPRPRRDRPPFLFELLGSEGSRAGSFERTRLNRRLRQETNAGSASRWT